MNEISFLLLFWMMSHRFPQLLFFYQKVALCTNWTGPKVFVEKIGGQGKRTKCVVSWGSSGRLPTPKNCLALRTNLSVRFLRAEWKLVRMSKTFLECFHMKHSPVAQMIKNPWAQDRVGTPCPLLDPLECSPEAPLRIILGLPPK